MKPKGEDGNERLPEESRKYRYQLVTQIKSALYLIDTAILVGLGSGPSSSTEKARSSGLFLQGNIP